MRNNAPTRPLSVGWDQRACERRPTVNDVAIGGPALASSLVPPYHHVVGAKKWSAIAWLVIATCGACGREQPPLRQVAAKPSPSTKEATVDRSREIERPAVEQTENDERSTPAPVVSGLDKAPRPDTGTKPPDVQPAVDEKRIAAAGIRTIVGNHLTLFTDLPADDAIDALPQLFDRAVPLWCAYFAVDESDAAKWQVRGCLMNDAERFKTAGLLPNELPPFAHGFTRGNEIWWYEPSWTYYRSHLMIHEGTHAFLNCRFGTCGPPWYMEATAELLATHRMEGDRLRLAYFPAHRDELPGWGRIKIVLDAVGEGRGLTIDEILAYPPDANLNNEVYGWCWAIAAFLDGHPRYHDRFRSLVAELRAEDFNGRFRSRFADDRQDLDLEWQAFTHELDYGYDLARAAIEFRPAKPLAEKGQTIAIAADRGWQSSGIRLSAGSEYEIAGRGRYEVADQPHPWWCEPGGVTLRYYRGRPLGMLLATVLADDEPNWPAPVAIGLGGKLSPEKSGTLYLRINDSPAELADNAGSLEVHARSR
ncbi:MAG TPA: hypothetical protein VNH11_24555 [Pirellulales bacterium]|nr:hypothetical protein [Pirellulales bacterium]